MSGTVTIRVMSPDYGQKRIQTKTSEKVSSFLEKVQTEFGLGDSGWSVYQERNNTGELKYSRSKTISSYKIKHGDMLYLSPSARTKEDMDTTDSTSSTASSPTGAPAAVVPTQGGKGLTSPNVVEDEVDQCLEKLDGKIQRERNEQLCRHGPSHKCLHCVPLEPYDEEYLQSADPPIKFLSFHSYVRKLRGGVDKGKFATLENLSCKIKPGCTEHPPWPGGICTKCQPNAVTLNRQRFRHIDYIQFENPFLMERFLNYWRSTGNQRIGLMYGRYEHHKDLPLAIKAVVAAIYEPPQISRKNSVDLLEDEDQELVDNVTKKLGLIKVGWIFTDLIAQDLSEGTVRHFRGNIDSHFLSAEECIMAADFQSKHPSPCKLSCDGHFGSKFVTVVVTGDKDNQIHFEGYQVSDQCMALVRDDCLVPTKDAPELGYVKESSNEQYVPDVFFKEKDTYGNEVLQLARPLPVEYLILDMAAAFPVEPMFTFPQVASGIKPFPIRNRAEMGDIQDFHAFAAYMGQYDREHFLNAMSDFQLLLFMAHCDILPVKDNLDSLLEAVKNKDETLAHHWSKTEEWATVEHLIQANVPSPSVSRQASYVGPGASPLPPIGGASGTEAMWTCKHCTFINQPGHTSCDICSLPKEGH